MKLVKITQKEVIENREKYFHDKKQFLVRIEGAKYYRTATIVRFEDWDDDLRKEVYYRKITLNIFARLAQLGRRGAPTILPLRSALVKCFLKKINKKYSKKYCILKIVVL